MLRYTLLGYSCANDCSGHFGEIILRNLIAIIIIAISLTGALIWVKTLNEGLRVSRPLAEPGYAFVHDPLVKILPVYNLDDGEIYWNRTEIVKRYRKAAEQGQAIAQYNLGVMYANGQDVQLFNPDGYKSYGQGVPLDYTEAVKWYRKAAEQGYAKAQYNLGVMYANGQGVQQDYTEAVKWYRKAAEQGKARAQYNLGVMYANGQGVQQDYTEAVKWYRKAAEQGKVQAQYYLGVMYANGQGVQQNYTGAVKWYRRAAKQGKVEAQYNLGVMYANGRGVPQDYILAHMWFNISGANGINKGQDNRDIVEKNMAPAQIAEAQKKAQACVASYYQRCD